jgi:hypothetical protein
MPILPLLGSSSVVTPFLRMQNHQRLCWKQRSGILTLRMWGDDERGGAGAAAGMPTVAAGMVIWVLTPALGADFAVSQSH